MNNTLIHQGIYSFINVCDKNHSLFKQIGVPHI